MQRFTSSSPQLIYVHVRRAGARSRAPVSAPTSVQNSLTGQTDFTLAEDEWDRVILECGGVLGGALPSLRMFMALGNLRQWQRCACAPSDIFCPAFLFGACAVPMKAGNWTIHHVSASRVSWAAFVWRQCVFPTGRRGGAERTARQTGNVLPPKSSRGARVAARRAGRARGSGCNNFGAIAHESPAHRQLPS